MFEKFSPLCKVCFKDLFTLERDRERESMCMGGGVEEREKEREKLWQTLPTKSRAQRWAKSQDPEIPIKPKSRAST